MNKIIYITILSVAINLQSCAQKTDNEKIPEKVLSSFKVKFPDADKTVWEMENESDWEAEFKQNGKKYSASFNSDGDWLETEYEINESEIPEDVKAIISQNFTDYDIEEVEIAETPSGQYYEMEIEMDGEEFEIKIDSEGNLTKEKALEDTDEEQED